MKLHRLALTNYRGIAHREITFPDRGVVVICGANEVGKSSMIEALDLLLEVKDRSKQEKVNQVKPVHADVGSEVLAEITTGPYRFVYRKRFHKGFETELTILEPTPEHLTGDIAHERVQAMFADTVDTGLWQAQRVLQAGSTALVDLSDCNALTNALDVAAGDDSGLPGTEPLLMDAIESEFGKYFTPTGRPNSKWKDGQSVLASAVADAAHCQAALDEVQELVDRHADLTVRLADLAAQRKATIERRVKAEMASAALAELTAQLHKARIVAAAAKSTSEASAAAHAGRLELAAGAEARAQTVKALGEELAAAAEAEVVAGQFAGMSAAAAVDSAESLRLAQLELDRVRGLVDAVERRGEADRIAARLEQIAAAHADLQRIDQELSGITLTDTVMIAIAEAAVRVKGYEDQLTASTGTVEFTAASDLELVIDGEPISLSAGDRWRPSTPAPTVVELPGLLSVRIDPGPTAASVQAQLGTAQRELDEALAHGGVADVVTARQVEQRRGTLTTDRNRVTAKLEGLCSGDDVGALQSRLAGLRAALPDEATDPEAANAALKAAETAWEQICRQAKIDQDSATATATEFTGKAQQTKLVQDRLKVAEGESMAALERLRALRAEVDDGAVAARAVADAEALRRADAAVFELVERHASASPDVVARELTEAIGSAEALDREHAEIDRELNEITGAVQIVGSEGRKGRLDEALNRREHAQTEDDRTSRRARAVRLLKSVMDRHRDDTRKGYVEPFRAELERLGKPVFGSTLQVEVGSDLSIVSRTLNGITVPYSSLSGGAKEQLGILVRLACAALIDEGDTVPVVIDDALGFADPDRLHSMAAVFNTVGHDGQVIVLTCTPGRYDGIEGAQIIELTG
jgi:recombinational DNA repair ATPase RecF